MITQITIRSTLTIVKIFCVSFIASASGDKNGNAFFDGVDSLSRHGNHELAIDTLNDFISEELNTDSIDYKIVSWAYLKQGQLNQTIGRSFESIVSLENALKYAYLSEDSIEISNAHYQLGSSYTILGRYEEALESYARALEIDRALESWMGVAMDLNSIGRIYEVWGKFDQALKFLIESLAISEEIGNQNLIALRYASIGSVYKSKSEYSTALEWLYKSLELEKNNNNKLRQGYRFDQIGEIYTLQGNFELANYYLNKALSIFNEKNIPTSQSITLNHLGLNSLKNNDYNNAITFYNKSLSIAKEINHSNMLIKNKKGLSELYKAIGDFKRALDFYQQYVEQKDSAFTEKASQELMFFKAKFETEKKEKELAVLNQEKLERELALNKSKQQKAFMIGLSIILITLLITIYNRYMLKKQAQIKLSAINTQLKETNKTKDLFFNIMAHDLKNPIYAFRNISLAVHDNYKDLDRNEIVYYLKELKSSSGKLCTFLDDLLKWASSQIGRIKPTVQPFKIRPIIDEVVHLHQTMLSEKDIALLVDIPETHEAMADKNMIKTVLRNIISNAIKSTENKGQIKVLSKNKSDTLTLQICDNGKGMSRETIKNLFSITSKLSGFNTGSETVSGLGLILSDEFIRKNNGSIEVESSIGKGSIFSIHLPSR
ncbi:tetratricopeptide repeat-containing sensor histidine kinase [Natronoflexus pectinivorans]|uniref:histidine kinase n=1 Tax=Natronoflexus pectinivorans TaxID=682526 RepID=A0A4R2GQL5_9BACT|nr:tetratricopeptide repeat protein [Natronoflexus pectinivorans]TCO11029.1 signal transduction histidine kinase [Natronoflexus pectinivorans]